MTTTEINTHRKLTQAELVAEARAAFGDDPALWAFRCPTCGDVANGWDFEKALTEHHRERNGNPVEAYSIVGQECIGRTLGALTVKTDEEWKGRGCTWVAYGLFRGPWEITLPDGRSIWGFPLATTPTA
ncbi:VVA0879 family protein [Streptomyces virginiae]|uniref:VVA0879 family protein n=1 Tax=Streptomyces virginiae TaxID=1961 RepID=UPI00366A4A3F